MWKIIFILSFSENKLTITLVNDAIFASIGLRSERNGLICNRNSWVPSSRFLQQSIKIKGALSADCSRSSWRWWRAGEGQSRSYRRRAVHVRHSSRTCLYVYRQLLVSHLYGCNHTQNSRFTPALTVNRSETVDTWVIRRPGGYSLWGFWV